LASTRCKSPAREKFRETIIRFRFLSPQGRKPPWLVAVSGGVDSIVLLHLLLNLPEELRPPLTVAHFNHRLRGRESDEEAEFVKTLCRRWKVPFVLGKAGKIPRANLEARARELRYAFLEKTAGRLRLRQVATAHQADDQAETFVIRWLQGAGLKGLSGIPLKRRLSRKNSSPLLIRPLLFIARHEIEEYAEEEGLLFKTDPTNQGDDFLRSRVRKWLSQLHRENPRLSERTSLQSLFLQADQALLESLVDDFFQKKVVRKKEKISCPVGDYQKLPEALRYRLLQRITRTLVSAEYALPSKAVLTLDTLLNDPTPRHRYDLPQGLKFEKDYVVFQMTRKEMNSKVERD